MRHITTLDITPVSVTDSDGNFCAGFEVWQGRVFEVVCQTSLEMFEGNVKWTMMGNGSEGRHNKTSD